MWESFDEEGRGWMRTEKLPALLEKLDIPLGFHSSKPMAKVAQKKALQELAMQLPDHDGWIHSRGRRHLQVLIQVLGVRQTLSQRLVTLGTDGNGARANMALHESMKVNVDMVECPKGPCW